MQPKLALLSLFCLLAPRAADAADWSPHVDVSNSCCGTAYPFTLQDGQGAHHVWWVEAEAGDVPRWAVRYTRDAGDGAFAPAVTLDADHDARFLAAAGEGPELHAVYSAYRGKYQQPCSADDTGGCSDVYFVESTDGGATWSVAAALPHGDDPVQREDPAIVRLPSGDLVVAYARDKRVATYRRPVGGAWGPESPVWPVPLIDQGWPSLAATTVNGEQHLHLLFSADANDGSANQLLYSRHDGAAWSEPASISAVDGGRMLSSMVSDGESRIQVAFQSVTDFYDVYYIESADDGASWSQPVKIDGGENPVLARELGGETVHLVWDSSVLVHHGEWSGQGEWTTMFYAGAGQYAREAHISAGPKDLAFAWQAHARPDAPINIFVSLRETTDPPPVGETGDDDSGTGEPTTGNDLSSGTGGGSAGDTGATPTSGGPATGGAQESTGGESGAASGGMNGGDEGGCGCSSGGSGPWWLGLGALAWSRRRRRARS